LKATDILFFTFLETQMALSLVNLFAIALAVGQAEGTLDGLNPTDAYFGHDDPCVAAGTCPGRKSNHGMFSIAMSTYSPVTELNHFTALASRTLLAQQEYGLSEWEAANFFDVSVQSPAAALGWNDARSEGLGFLYQLRHHHDKTMVQKRVDAYKNVNGEDESWDSSIIEADQARRVKVLAQVLGEDM
jgi:hypothetical protein